MSNINADTTATPRTRTETVFVVIKGEQGTPLRDWIVWDGGREYRTAAEAQERAKVWSGIYDESVETSVRFAIRAVTREAEIPLEQQEWFQRELSRFVSGEYKSLPFDVLDYPPLRFAFGAAVYWENVPGFGRLKHHLVHFSVNQPGNIAFTESIEKGERDIQTSLTPRRYLERYFSIEAARSYLGEGANISDIHYLRPEEIDHLADQLAGDETFTLTITKDQEEIEKVYTYGPRSCMGGPLNDARTSFKDANYFSTGGIHPARVYGGKSSTGLAYLMRDGRYTARVVVDTEEKVYSRTYGDSVRIKRMLEAQGYTAGSLEGSTINRIEHPDGNGSFVCPYIDEVYRVGLYSTDFLVISSDGELAADHTDGRAFYGRPCDRCEDTTADNDLIHVQHEGRWCPSCVESYAFTCEDCGEVFDNDNLHVTESGHVCDSCVDEYVYSEHVGCYIHTCDAFHCPDCGEYFPEYHAETSDHDDLERCLSCHNDHNDTVTEQQREAEQELETIAPEYCASSSEAHNASTAA